MRRHTAFLVTTLVLAVIAAGFPAAAQISVAPGYDLFETKSPGTGIGIGELGIRAVEFIGVSLTAYDFGGAIGPQYVAGTDTIIQRKGAATPESPTIEVEIVALQLVSLQPVQIPYTPVPTQVYVTLQSHRGASPLDPPPGPPSTGKLTIQFNDVNSGGTFDSFFDVFFDLRYGSIHGPIFFSGNDRLAASAGWGRSAAEQRTLDELGRLAAHGVLGPSWRIPGVNVLLNGKDESTDFHAGDPPPPTR